ncbi:MAG: protein kinase [Limisphaerales bacterium]
MKDSFPPKSPYQPQGEIARGGMGAVFHVVDAKLERSVAMKVMLRTRASEGEQWRFQQEARVLGQLAHPNIVPIHDLGVDEQGRPFYTMKLVQGVTLQELITRLKSADAEALARYPLRQLLAIFQKVCDGVAFAHSRGIIHRDLKPQNIMVGEYGEVLVMDWGLAKILPGSPAAQAKCLPPAPAIASPTPPTSEPAPALSSEAAETLAAGESPGVSEPKLSFGQPAPPPSQASGSALTLEGRVMGTPHYMSPEQAEGRVHELDERTDIFALGGILYALLTLRPPVDGANVEEMLAKARRGDITPPSALNARTGTINTHRKPTGEVVRPTELVPLPHMPGGRVPPGLSAVAMKALAPIPVNRYPSVVALSGDINAFQGGFATSAEKASALTLFRLLIHRHKAFAAAASLFVLLTLGFIVRLVASERRALEQTGLAQSKTLESARTLAHAQISLAEAAYRDQDATMMLMTLGQVAKEHRSEAWDYLMAKADSASAKIPALVSSDIHCVVPHPKQPGVFVVADRHRLITLVEPATGRKLGRFPITLGTNLPTPHFQLAIDADGERIAVVGGGWTNAAVYRLSDGTLLQTVASPDATRAAFSRDGQRLFLHASPGSASMVELATGRELWRSYESLRWAPLADDRRIFAASYKGVQHLLDALDGKPLVPPVSTRQDITAVAASASDDLVFLGFGSGVIRGVFPDGFKLKFESRDTGSPIEFFATTPDGRWLVSLATETESGRQSLQLWETGQGQRIRGFLGGGGKARSLGIHPLSHEIVVGGQNSRVWTLPRHDPRWRIANCWLPEPQGVFWGSDDVLFTQIGKEPLKLKNWATQEVLWEAPEAVFRTASVSADQRFAYVSGRSSGLPSYWLTNSANPQVLAEVAHGTTKLTSSELSPDGARLALVRDTRLVVRELSTGQERSFHVVGNPKVGNPVWINDRRLAFSATTGTAGSDGAMNYLVARQTDSTNQHYSTRSPVAILALSAEPGGSRLAEAGQNNMIRIRNTTTLEGRKGFRAHDRAITALAWHPRLPLLASASADLSIKIWNADSGKLLEEFIGPAGAPISLRFSPSGNRLACAAADRTVHVWDLGPASLDTPAPVVRPLRNDVDDWQDLISRVDDKDVRLNGRGWVLNHGVLTSPMGTGNTIALPGHFAGTNYNFRVTFRQLHRGDGLAVMLPVGDRRTAFFFDAWPDLGVMSGFDMDRSPGVTAAQPETIKGQRVTNAEPHTLEFLVRSGTSEARITVRLDGKPFTEWRGKPTDLSISRQWRTVPTGAIALGTHRSGWAVTEAKVKPLPANPFIRQLP